MNKSFILLTVICLCVGGVVGYLIHPDAEIYKPDVSKYRYENEIQELKYKAEISKFETKYLQRLHFIEDADSTQLDSLWLNYDF